MSPLDDVVGDFLTESRENLDQFDRDLVGLETCPESQELLGNIFRAIHTIKGTLPLSRQVPLVARRGRVLRCAGWMRRRRCPPP